MIARLANGAREPSGRPPRTGGAPRIAIVADDGLFRGLVCELLAGAGYEVTAAATADEARALGAAGGLLDLLLVDVQLDHESGRRLGRQFRSTRPRLHVVYMSGPNRRTALVDGNQPSLCKPFFGDDLLSTVASVLKVGPGDPLRPA